MDATSVEYTTSSNRLHRLYYGLTDAMTQEPFAGSSEIRSCDTITEEPPKLEIPQLFERVLALNEIIRQIRELISGPPKDEQGILRPTQKAVDRVAELLIESCVSFIVEKQGRVFPRAGVAPDLDGGLRIEWTLASGTVTLVVPPGDEQHEYLCKRVGGTSKVEFSLSGSMIANWLKRLS